MPLDSSINNTTSLNGTGIGTRRYTNATSNVVSETVSAHNLDYSLRNNDQRVIQLRDDLIKKVSSWMKEDKISILARYGDLSKLKKNPTDDEINTLLAETMLVHLNPRDLDELVSQVRIDDLRIKKEIQVAETHRKSAVRGLLGSNKQTNTYFNTGTFEDAFAKTRNAKNTDQYIKGRKAQEKGYDIPEGLISRYGNLRRELRDVLHNGFNQIELISMAQDMNIEFADGTSARDIEELIVNKTILYVDLIVGHSHGGYANMFMSVEPYNKLLSMTSYSYVTGKPGLDPREWIKMKNDARIAKKAVKERMRMQNSRVSTRSKDFRAITGGAHGSALATWWQIRSNDRGALKDASYEQLMELAGKYGVDPSTHSVAVLKRDIYRAMAAEAKRTNELKGLTAHNMDIGRLHRNPEDLLAIHQQGTDAQILGAGTSSLAPSTGISTPLVHFDKNGSVLDASILLAVPVYLVGQGPAGIQNGNVAPGGVAAPKGKGILGILGKSGISKQLSSNITSQDQLSDEEKQMLNYVTSLPETIAPNNRPGRFPQSIIEFEDYLINHLNADPNVIVNIKRDAELNYDNEHNKLLNRARRDLWVWAVLTHHRNLASLLTNSYSIYYKHVQSAASTLRHFGKNIGIGTGVIGGTGLAATAAFFPGGRIALATVGGVAVLAGIGTTIAHGINMRSIVKNADGNNYTDLPDRSASVYQQVKNMKTGDLINILRYSDIDVEQLLTFNNVTQSAAYLNAQTAAQKNELIQGNNFYYRGTPACKKEILTYLVLRFSKDKKYADKVASDYSFNVLLNKFNLKAYPPVQQFLKHYNSSARTGIGKFFRNTRNVSRRVGNLVSNLFRKRYAGSKMERDDALNKSQADIDKDNGTNTNSKMPITNIPIIFGDFNLENGVSIDKDAVEKAVPVYVLNKQFHYALRNANSALSSSAKSLRIHNIIDTTGAQPVYVVNKDSDSLTDSTNYLKSISSYLSVTLPILFAGLQEAGTTVNGAAGAAGIAKGVTTAKELTDFYTDVQKYSTNFHATGTQSQAHNTMTRFISGDSPKGLNTPGSNPEQVNIDWQKKSFSVKPIRKFANGGASTTSSSESARKLTTSEKNQPMAVGISSHIVKYNKALADGYTEGSNAGEAIKVYAVNPGIADKIDVGGSQVSLIDIVANINSLLASVVQSSVSNTQLLGTVATNTTSLVKAASSSASKTTDANPFAGGFPTSLNKILAGN